MKLTHLTGAVTLATLVAAAVPAVAQQQTGSPIRKRSIAEDMQLFSQVLNQIRVNHPDSIDTHDLMMAAIEGMVRAADPHSFVIPAVRLDSAKERAAREGKLYPVPISFSYLEGSPVVFSVAPGSDASAQDIIVGDELVSIDGQSVAARSAEELDVTLAGEKNSTVKLGFERQRTDGSRAHVERVVKRQRVEEQSAVLGVSMLDAQTGYARITTFENEKVADDMHDALGRLEKQGMQRLVLDLRDNGGGSVAEAAHVAGEFLPKGAIVYTSEGRKEEVTDTGRVKRSFWRSERRYPIVLLVNGGTASASEIVAGALQDHDRALIVGRPTFGKSLLMGTFPLTDGSIVLLVIGHVKTPCGRVVQRQYHGLSTREYYRLAEADRDTAGRPSCKTDGGRTVYGGGGIYPDVVLPAEAGVPAWLARINENDLLLKWVNGWMGANGASVPALDTLVAHPTVPAAAVADFRRFAAAAGTPAPDGAEVDARLERALTRSVAMARYGYEGYYRVAAALDPAVREGVKAFDRASLLLGPPGAR